MSKNKLTQAVNWNRIEDDIDKATWEKLTSQFWIDTRIPVSNDLSDWDKLSIPEKDLYNKVFGGLTLLDTLQGEIGNNEIAKDSRNQHELAVFRNIAFMECLATGNSLLTPEGWVDVSDVKKGDLVLQYNEDGTTEFAPVVQTSSHIPDEMFRFSNKKFDLKVSSGHRMPFQYKEQGKNRKTNPWVLKTMTAKEYAKAPNTYFRRHILQSKVFNKSGRKKLTEKEKFLIAFQADGSIVRSRFENQNINSLSIRFTFSKEAKINYLKSITDKMDGYELREIKPTKEETAKAKRNFTMTVDRDFLGSINPDKNFEDFLNIEDFTQELADEFIEELSHWDSHIDKHLDDTITYYTTNESNSEFVQAVATLSSYYFTFNVNEDLRSDKYKDTYYIRMTKHEASGYYGYQSSTNKEEIEPEMVYGIEVPSTYLVVKTPRGMVVTGNCVHAKSYSTIFSTLSTMKEIDEVFKWTAENPYIIKKNEIVQDIYENGTPLQKKVASVFLESFLFYSGFFTPLYYAGLGKMKNTAEIIKLILRDESVHSAYIGYKHKLGFAELTETEQEEHEEWTFDLLDKLYQNELKYTELLYDEVGYTEDVKQFLKYNADKALMNLGFDTLFEVGREDINPLVMNGISTETANHDFFSAVGNGYLLGEVEAMKDDDYALIKEKFNK